MFNQFAQDNPDESIDGIDVVREMKLRAERKQESSSDNISEHPVSTEQTNSRAPSVLSQASSESSGSGGISEESYVDVQRELRPPVNTSDFFEPQPGDSRPPSEHSEENRAHSDSDTPLTSDDDNDSPVLDGLDSNSPDLSGINFNAPSNSESSDDIAEAFYGKLMSEIEDRGRTIQQQKNEIKEKEEALSGLRDLLFEKELCIQALEKAVSEMQSIIDNKTEALTIATQTLANKNLEIGRIRGDIENNRASISRFFYRI